ncbi:SDR family oxidoreductase [Rhodanobacter glycinis]|uniref:SDR family oxidoreductase n=1 Tax=Rhodanobacter glycinis TaxID=582702 RepID=A0A5B9DYX2_9GAMM|nr:SDR family oxidoreductase [Rhodanobacter glycinis]QEE24404.1 SDR family oxidoreductase [Rhodanobacter glycinis]
MTTTWFITGSSSGFGRSMTETLLARGDRVAATLRKPTALDDLKAQYGDQLWVARLDVTDTRAVHQVIDQAFADLGRIDVVVNNAGYGLFGAAEEVTDAQIRQQIDTNVIGSIQVIRAALPHLRAQGGGRIVQVSSEGGQVAYPGFSLYHASKWAIEGFVESVAQEVAAFGVEFTIAEPGAARTQFGAGLVMPESMQIYEDSLVGQVRQMVMSRSYEGFGPLSNPEKVVLAMIDSAASHPAPRRLVMGSSSYTHIHEALTHRLDALEAQMDVAFSTNED